MTVAKYDGLNRPTGATAGAPAISYAVGGQTAATNPVTFTYDQGSNGLTGFKGALTSVSNTTRSKSYGYDGFGRITGSIQTTGTYPPFSFTYGYSLTDTLTSIHYPSGRQVNYTLGAGDLVTAVVNVTGSGNYASGMSYTPAGGLSAMTLGNSNTVTQTYSWNDRFQPTGVTAIQGGTTLLGLNFYPCPSNGTACASASGTGNNGNVLSQTIAMPGLNLTQTYTYDHLNRLTNAQETGGGANWSQTYHYDSVGNRWIVPTENTGLPAPTLETPQAQSWYSTTVPNRIASWSYDANGNVRQIANMARSFTYDGEDRQVTATVGSATATYAYDGEGQRVSKTVSGQTTTYVYDAFGNLAAEYGGSSASACGTCYVTTDHLGSTRLLTNTGGVFARYDYQPFGQEIFATIDGRTTAMGFSALLAPDNANPKFTGQYQDVETADPNTGSALDWFQVRQMSGAQGRFQSPDPANAGANPSNPQSWNGYAYVANNPLSYTDPSGMLTEAGGGGGDDGGDGGLAAVIVTGIVDALEAIFGGGGPPPSIAPSLATPSSPIMGPTFSVTGWGTADTVAPPWSAVDRMIPVVIPGLTFYAPQDRVLSGL